MTRRAEKRAQAARMYPRTARYLKAESLLRTGSVQLHLSDEQAEARIDDHGRRARCTWQPTVGYRCSCGLSGGRCSHVAALRIAVLTRAAVLAGQTVHSGPVPGKYQGGGVA